MDQYESTYPKTPPSHRRPSSNRDECSTPTSPVNYSMQLVYLHAQHEESTVYHISPPVVYDLSTQSFMTITLMILTIFVSMIQAYASNIDNRCAMASSTSSNHVGK